MHDLLLHDRTVKMHKHAVLRALEKNKRRHKAEYDKAVVGFRKKALKALAKAANKIRKGELTLDVRMVTPVDRSESFDTTIAMFRADVNSEVELSQNEYNDYILDKGNAAVTASMSNSYYTMTRASKRRK